MDKRIHQLLQFKKEGKFYYSFIIFENRRSSKYQLLLPRSEVIAFLSGGKNDLKISEVVKYILLNHLFNHTESSVINKFLNFHSDEFPGDKLDFIKRVEEDVVIFFDDLPKPPKEWINNIESFDDVEINGLKIIDRQREIIVDAAPYFENYTWRDYKRYEIINKYFNIWVKQKTNETQPAKNRKKTRQTIAIWRDDNDRIILEFKKLLIQYYFIDPIDDNEFVNHFTGKSFTEWINWKDEQTIFVRLFDEIVFAFNGALLLGGSNFLSTNELSKHFLINNKRITARQLTSTRNSIKYIPVKKDREIKQIKQRLKKFFLDT